MLRISPTFLKKPVINCINYRKKMRFVRPPEASLCYFHIHYGLVLDELIQKSALAGMVAYILFFILITVT
jgi:hypothetical protein